MNDLLRTNIMQSLRMPPDPFRIENAEVVSEDGSTVDLSKIPPFILEQTCGPLPSHPWFFINGDDKYRCGQEASFGFYALSTMISSILRAVSFIVAGEKIPGHLYSPAILCFYTGTYHTLTAYLATMGRVYTEPAPGRPRIKVNRGEPVAVGYGNLKEGVEVIAAILTRENRWCFEHRSRSHRKRWNELFQISRFEEVAPNSVREIAEYLSSHGGELLCCVHDILRFGIDRIPEIRHEAAYRAYGVDDFALELAMNEGVSAGGHLRREKMQKFARGWLGEVLKDVAGVVREARVHLDDHRSSQLRLAILKQPFEYGHLGDDLQVSYSDLYAFAYGVEGRRSRGGNPAGGGLKS